MRYAAMTHAEHSCMTDVVHGKQVDFCAASSCLQPLDPTWKMIDVVEARSHTPSTQLHQALSISNVGLHQCMPRNLALVLRASICSAKAMIPITDGMSQQLCLSERSQVLQTLKGPPLTLVL